MGSGFDLASGGEVDRCCALGIAPDRCCFGNTIKREQDIARAYALGIDFFAVDSLGELKKLARSAPGARVFRRLAVHGDGAEWPQTRKFGCTPHLAAELRHGDRDPRRWVYVDAGPYNGLAESLGEVIHYPVRTSREGGDFAPTVLAGPTCDSTDIIYDRANYALPVDLTIGDTIDFLTADAYTASYASVEFNGFPPVATYCFG